MLERSRMLQQSYCNVPANTVAGGPSHLSQARIDTQAYQRTMVLPILLTRLQCFHAQYCMVWTLFRVRSQKENIYALESLRGIKCRAVKSQERKFRPISVLLRHC